MAPVVGMARARPSLVIALVVASVALVAGCGREAPATADAVASPSAASATVGSTPQATAPPAADPPSTAVPATATKVTPTSEPPTTTASTAPPAVASLRGLVTTTSSATYVDTGRPTVAHGRTVAPTRILATTIVRPASGGPYPLVVFAHGFQLGPSNYQHLMTAIAAAGYVVAAPSFPLADASIAGGNLDRGDIPNQSGDLSFVIDQVLAGPLAGSVDRSRIAAVGHSDGADTVLDLGYHPQRRDTRVRAVAALAPDAMTGTVVGGPPLLVAHGDRDSIVSYRNATTVFAQVPSHRFLVTLVGADHLPPVQGAPPWSAVVDAVVVDLLDAQVSGRGTEGTIVRDATVPGVASVEAAG